MLAVAEQFAAFVGELQHEGLQLGEGLRQFAYHGGYETARLRVGRAETVGVFLGGVREDAGVLLGKHLARRFEADGCPLERQEIEEERRRAAVPEAIFEAGMKGALLFFNFGRLLDAPEFGIRREREDTGPERAVFEGHVVTPAPAGTERRGHFVVVNGPTAVAHSGYKGLVDPRHTSPRGALFEFIRAVHDAAANRGGRQQQFESPLLDGFDPEAIAVHHGVGDVQLGFVCERRRQREVLGDAQDHEPLPHRVFRQGGLCGRDLDDGHRVSEELLQRVLEGLGADADGGIGPGLDDDAVHLGAPDGLVHQLLLGESQDEGFLRAFQGKPGNHGHRFRVVVGVRPH